MKSKSALMYQATRRRLLLALSFAFLLMLAMTSFVNTGRASLSPASGDTCASATVINPAALPFLEDSTLLGAGNDINPGPGGCVAGAGNDAVYSFTPTATDTYTIGVTPIDSFDASLYIVTDCANPAGTCIAGVNTGEFDRGESLVLTLNSGIRYFVVVDTPGIDNNAGRFHFSLRRGRPANDSCATPAVIDPSRLPFSFSGTTFGATDDTDPASPCLPSTQSGKGPDVVFQFTPADTQLYLITVTPKGRYDTAIYLTTDCVNIAGCIGADNGGGGVVETLPRTLISGTTYYITVDGFGGDAGDFVLSLQPSNPRAPSAPSELTATAVSTTQINLLWKDNSGDEQGFRVERGFDGFNFTEIASVGPNVTAFNDTTATPNTLFFYRIFAFNGFGNSDPSNVAFAMTPGIPVPVNPAIVVDPTSLDFGSVRVTQSSTKTVIVSSVGGADLIISSISDPGGAFSIVGKPTLPLTLIPGQSVTLTVRFAPVVLGRVTGSFSIQSNDPAAPFSTVFLAGTGTASPVPNLEPTPGIVDFGSTKTVVDLTIKNTGDADLLISSAILPNAPFSVLGTPAGILSPGGMKVLSIVFAPSTIGVYTGALSLVSNDPDALITFIPLKATALVVPPNVVGLQFKKKGLRFLSAGANVATGAVLIVDGTQTFTLDLGDGIWQVLKSTRSTPGGLRIIDIFTPGSTHTVVVKNPNGGSAGPFTITG